MVNRAVVIGASTSVSLVLGWVVYDAILPSHDGVTVELVDQGESVVRLLEERAGGAGPARAPRGQSDQSGDAAVAALATGGLARESLDFETARRLFATVDRNPGLFHPQMYFRERGNLERKRKFSEHPDGGWKVITNSLGMRETAEPAATQPDLRILATGDSHTAGVCPIDETFPNVLEGSLATLVTSRSVEVLNAGMGGYCLYNYVGVLEAYLDLEPDAFIVCIYGGNDFSEMMPVQCYFERRSPPARGPYKAKKLVAPGQDQRGLGAQEFSQALYYLNNPDDEAVAVETMIAGTRDMLAICAAHDIELVFVYLPPPSRGQPAQFGEQYAHHLGTLGLDRDVMAISDRIADGWLAFLEEARVRHVDLRPTFGATEEPLYWSLDLHLNTAGHRLVSEALQPLLRHLLPTD